jgi:hypothetical protein
MNPYVYVMDNPLRYTDPTGMVTDQGGGFGPSLTATDRYRYSDPHAPVTPIVRNKITQPIVDPHAPNGSDNRYGTSQSTVIGENEGAHKPISCEPIEVNWNSLLKSFAIEVVQESVYDAISGASSRDPFSVGAGSVSYGLFYGWKWIANYGDDFIEVTVKSLDGMGDDVLKSVGKEERLFKMQLFGSKTIFPKSGSDIKSVFGVTDKVFHKEIKPEILKQIQSDPLYSKIFKTMGNNPDIGVDSLGNVILKDVRTGKILPTTWSFESFLP